MSPRRKALLEAALICSKYADNLLADKPEWADVALECAAMIEDASEEALTIAEIGGGSCQELSSFLVAPEIDYTSGFPSK